MENLQFAALIYTGVAKGNILPHKELSFFRYLSCEFAATIATVFPRHITASISGTFSETLHVIKTL
jgi:hypothetical protein